MVSGNGKRVLGGESVLINKEIEYNTEKKIANLQRHIRAMLCQSHLIQQQHSDSVVGMTLKTTGHFILMKDGIRVRHRRTLVRDDVDGGELTEEERRGLFPVEV